MKETNNLEFNMREVGRSTFQGQTQVEQMETAFEYIMIPKVET